MSDGFLIGIGAFGAALALGVLLVLPVLRRKAMKFLSTGFRMPRQDLSPPMWIEVLPDERIRLLVPKAELGQGIRTGLAQLVAEELEVAWEKLEVVHATTHQAENKYRGTVGSMSMSSLYEPFRHMAATLREMLRAEASARLGEPADRLVARGGAFEVVGDEKRRITYGALVGKNTRLQAPKAPVALKSPEQFKIIGRSMPRVDGRAMVTGRAVFCQDLRAEAMLFGAVLRPPSLGAKLVSVEPGSAASMPGVVKVVIEGGFAGVVARSREQALEARDALDAKWDKGHTWQQDEIEKLVTVGGPHGVCIQRKGSALAILDKGASLTAEYRTALVAHASMETQSALAQVGPSGGKVWTSTQAETFTAGLVSKALGLKRSQIEIIPTLVGGGFGRKAINNSVASAAVEAAIFSRSAGAPVHVAWDRSEEMRHGFLRPMTHHRISAKLRDGRIDAIHWQEASGDSLLGTMPAQELLARLIGFDPGAVTGAWIRYSIPNLETTAWRRRLPLLTGPWRGLGLAANTFALETFIDEAADAAGKDPVRFRLDHLGDDRESQRLAAVVEAAAEGAGWGGGTLPEGHARGIACCAYHGTPVAEVAEISLDERSGRIRVHDVVAAIDCGRAINPDQVRSQVEGCIVMGTSAALLEEITVRDGRVTAGDFREYPILRLSQAPRVKTIIVEPPGGKPSGCGEPPIGPIAPAIGNAFFALTRRRLRETPLSPSRVLAALGV